MTWKKATATYSSKRCILSNLISEYSDELILFLEEVQTTSGQVAEMVPDDVLEYVTGSSG
jgi:hypothetical protein